MNNCLVNTRIAGESQPVKVSSTRGKVQAIRPVKALMTWENYSIMTIQSMVDMGKVHPICSMTIQSMVDMGEVHPICSMTIQSMVDMGGSTTKTTCESIVDMAGGKGRGGVRPLQQSKIIVEHDRLESTGSA